MIFNEKVSNFIKMSSEYNLDFLDEEGFGCFDEPQNKTELDDSKIEEIIQASISNMNNRKKAQLRERQREILELQHRRNQLLQQEADMYRIQFENRNINNTVNTISLSKLTELMKKVENNNEPCPICFENKEELEITLCGHIFCKKCIESIKNNKCPMCRS